VGINPLLLCILSYRILESQYIPMLVVSFILANREVLALYLWRLLNNIIQ
jgi:hypothetical protein